MVTTCLKELKCILTRFLFLAYFSKKMNKKVHESYIVWEAFGPLEIWSRVVYSFSTEICNFTNEWFFRFWTYLEQNFCNKKTALCCIQIYGVENIHLLLNSESEVYLWRLAFLKQNSTLFEASSDSVVGFIRSKKEKLTSPKCFFKRRKNSCINTFFVTCISRNGNELSRWSMRRDKDIFYLWMETSYLLN